MFNSLRRWLRHLWLDAADTRRLLDADAQERLAEHVRSCELRHGGEIRVCVEAALPIVYLWGKRSARDRALDVFSELRVWDTERNNGVLIYLLLADQQIEIIADRALHRHVGASHWAELIAELATALRQTRYEDGLHRAIDAVSAHLQSLDPAAASPDANELPDTPLLR